MFKRKTEEHELLKKRIEKLDNTVTSMAGYVGYKGDRLWSLAIYDKPALKIRVEQLEDRIATLSESVNNMRHVLITAGIIEKINDEEPALVATDYSIFGDAIKSEYGVTKAAKAGKKRG